MNNKPCECDPDKPTCKPTTRVGVIITDLQGIGVWRLELHGWNGAQELAGTIDIMKAVNPRGMVAGRLKLHERQSKSDGKTHNFVVPVLDLNLSVAALTEASTGAQLPAGNLTPIPRLEAGQAPSVAEQLAAVDDVASRTKPGRANAATKLPATGLAPRSAATVASSPVKSDSGVNEGNSTSSDEDAAVAIIDKTFKKPQPSPDDAKRARILRRLFALLGGIDIKTDEQRHKWASKGLGEPVKSYSDLNVDQINTLIDIAEGTRTAANNTGDF